MRGQILLIYTALSATHLRVNLLFSGQERYSA